jgi:hypothetical protein
MSARRNRIPRPGVRNDGILPDRYHRSGSKPETLFAFFRLFGCDKSAAAKTRSEKDKTSSFDGGQRVHTPKSTHASCSRQVFWRLALAPETRSFWRT